ncbi:Putative 115 kDa protein in type-1 retrotransposable element R1DM [Eumeta japonica]|uniref:115 kDa protein in type-1 retrotransposable element R1DM n=1 Tax=Eumeta variegata TaxID=151549 RepID=A0A4C1YXV6_EUMVA|nr:Putative 115 kDa protein in type-1 retrotransposable element R1DM [Eumeta japonica]
MSSKYRNLEKGLHPPEILQADRTTTDPGKDSGKINDRPNPMAHASLTRPKQYGFMSQRRSEDALYDLINHVKKAIESKKAVLLISLDKAVAFDNAWRPALKTQLVDKKCPSNLYQMACCVQGSICGPTFWNIIIDSLLQRLTDAKVHYQAFADDVVLAFSSESSSTIENAANKAMQIVTKWGSENKLNLAPQKTQAMVLTKKLKFQNPTIQMADSQINLVEEIRVLGIIIDTRLNFRSHVAAVCKKFIAFDKRLACSAKVTWGLNSKVIRITQQ